MIRVQWEHHRTRDTYCVSRSHKMCPRETGAPYDQKGSTVYLMMVSVFPACKEPTEISGAHDTLQGAAFVVDTSQVAVSYDQMPIVEATTDTVAEIQNILCQGRAARFAGQRP